MPKFNKARGKNDFNIKTLLCYYDLGRITGGFGSSFILLCISARTHCGETCNEPAIWQLDLKLKSEAGDTRGC